MITLPPEGAARQVGENLWKAFAAALPEQRRKLFDTKLYQDGFDRLLKDPGDDMVVDLLNQSLVVQALDFEATHVLVLALSPVTAFTSNLLKRRGMIMVHWFYEDFRQAEYWRDVLPTYTHFLAIQRGPVEAACLGKGVNFRYLPTAAAVAADAAGAGTAGPAPKPWRERSGGLVFIGIPSGYRMAVLAAIAAAGLPLRIAGSGWEKYRGPLERCLEGNGWAGPDQVRALLGDAQAALHLPYEDPAVDRDNSHISPRIFDILASGCVLLCEDAPLIRETIRGCAYKEFRGAAEAVSVARQALSEGIPQATLEANRDAVLREHSFARRVAQLQAL